MIKDVQEATDGLGPEAAVVAAGDVRGFHYSIYFFFKIQLPNLDLQVLPFNQALMYLRRKGTLVCVGMPAGNAFLNVPVPLLIAKVKYIYNIISYCVELTLFFLVHDYCGIGNWVTFSLCAFPLLLPLISVIYIQ